MSTAKLGAEAPLVKLPRAPQAGKHPLRPKTPEQIAERIAPQLTGNQFVRLDSAKSINPAGKSEKQWELEQGMKHDIR
jgi:hypothetical protein